MTNASVFALPTGYFVILAIAALVIALIVVAVMRGKLKTAKRQSSAGNYIRKDSLSFSVREDRFLYRTQERRRIEKNNK